jgi:hypothetical protein
MDEEQLHDKLFQEFKHHPLNVLDIIPATAFLHKLGQKTKNLAIIEAYNESDRIKEAYKNFRAQRTSELKRKKREAIHRSGSSGRKIKSPPQQDDEENDQGGV